MIFEPDQSDTYDYSIAAQQRRNFIMMVVMYVICCAILAGVLWLW